MRLCVERMAKTHLKQETEHDRYVLGLVIGGDEGRDLVSQARQGLRECGVNDPDTSMRAYAPELLR
jgi:hypothetical protein